MSKIWGAVPISDMGARDALWWGARLGPHHALVAGRADRYWSWTALLPACHLIQLSKRRYCRPLVIWAQADNGQFVRVGMSIIIERYPHLDTSAGGEAHFMWFMCAAETTILVRDFQMSNPPSLSRSLLDNAVVLSMNAGLSGHIGLHAAAAGGTGLLAVYRKAPLLQLPSAALLPSTIRRTNDGRFFYSDDATAQSVIGRSDQYR